MQYSNILDHVFEKKSVTKTGPDPLPPKCNKCYTFFFFWRLPLYLFSDLNNFADGYY